ncbi:substrate-binding domain-containing protein [Prosthecobacter vanneervenii]|uniref:ABC-type sugar transport system substrate-binding protein n=1 Tax=Prosthecobacter vanneervenii TaxID=48466 RepID=A0A7W8DKQ7_9BACT|nr:substrate-binding domain-containing protein [Prosthecobacter vanneervenii]MBB5033468.1 ABC-type sugar transport system substrate-binding protein [Prosthecobacter vanneervenii]
MSLPFIRTAALCLATALLPACGPSEPPASDAAPSSSEPAAQKPSPQQSTPATPAALLSASSLAAKDERAEIRLLLSDARIAMQAFQRDGLSMLVGRRAGYQLTTSDAEGSSARQIEQFRQSIATKPAAIIVSPIDPAALAALIVEAKTQGIIVIGLDKRMLNEGCASIVYSDQRLMGRLAAETVVEALKRKAAEENRTDITGRIVQLRGAADSHTSSEMAEGFGEGLRSQPGIIIVHDAPADWNTEKATQRTAEAFKLQQSFDAIYAHSDAIAVGAAKAAETAGRRDNVFIIGTDGLSGQKRGLESVRDGEIDASVIQPALVDLALQIIAKLRTDKTFKPQPAYEIQPMVILPKNVEQCLRTGTYKLPQL